MSKKWIAVHRGTKRDIERGADFYRIGPEIDVADPDCACPTIKDEWRANQIVNQVNATIAAVAAKDATIAELREALERLDAWFDTDPEILDAMTPDERADHDRQRGIIRAALEAKDA